MVVCHAHCQMIKTSFPTLPCVSANIICAVVITLERKLIFQTQRKSPAVAEGVSLFDVLNMTTLVFLFLCCVHLRYMITVELIDEICKYIIDFTSVNMLYWKEQMFPMFFGGVFCVQCGINMKTLLTALASISCFFSEKFTRLYVPNIIKSWAVFFAQNAEMLEKSFSDIITQLNVI